MLQDLKSNIGVAVSLVPAVRTAGAANGLAVNLTGFLSAVVAFSFGDLGGGSATCKVQESADGSTNWADIASDRLNGALVAASANSVQTVGLISPWLGGVVSDETKTKFIIRKEVSCYYILPTGIGVETASGSAESQSEISPSNAELKTILSNPYTYLLKALDLRWPYAGCGAIYNSNSTINKAGHLSQIIGALPGTYPHPWPFGNGFSHPVGYV